jgi:hypothetical protein
MLLTTKTAFCFFGILSKRESKFITSKRDDVDDDISTLLPKFNT